MLEDCLRNDKDDQMMRFLELTQQQESPYYFNAGKYLSRLPIIRNRRPHQFVGETCAICLDPIVSRTTGWVTRCAHAFHKLCLRRWCTQTHCHGTCPHCRGDVGAVEFLDGLRYTYPFRSGLDLLEEIDNIIHRYCHDCEDVLGMTPGCPRCARYRQQGL